MQGIPFVFNPNPERLLRDGGKRSSVRYEKEGQENVCDEKKFASNFEWKACPLASFLSYNDQAKDPWVQPRTWFRLEGADIINFFSGRCRVRSGWGCAPSGKKTYELDQQCLSITALVLPERNLLRNFTWYRRADMTSMVQLWSSGCPNNNLHTHERWHS